jgi:glycosyltransferase involved in cell wall biosynthesis
VITLRDSGGPLEVVHDEINGLVIEPEARALARAIDQLFRDRARARRMGEQAFASLAALGISWDHVTEQLLA